MSDPSGTPEPQDANDDARRWRRVAIASGVALVVLVGAFVSIDRGSGDESEQRAADLVASGLTAYTQRDYQTARQSFRTAITHDDENPFAHYNLGLIMHVVDNNPAGAEASYRRALELKPDLAAALFNLGVLRAGAGAKDEAEQLYRRAIKADPRFASPRLNLGFLLYERDPNSAEAWAEFDRAKRLDPALASRIPAPPTTTTTSTPA